jgi:hypothetical protein
VTRIVAGRLLNPQVTWWPVSPEDIVDSRKAQTRGQARKHGKPSLDQIEFYRVLDSLPSAAQAYCTEAGQEALELIGDL